MKKLRRGIVFWRTWRTGEQEIILYIIQILCVLQLLMNGEQRREKASVRHYLFSFFGEQFTRMENNKTFHYHIVIMPVLQFSMFSVHIYTHLTFFVKMINE